MKQYLKNQKTRLRRQQFTQLGLIGDSFTQFRYQKIKLFIRSMNNNRIKQQFTGYFPLLHEQTKKKCPFQILKILIFCHMTVQEISQPKYCEQIFAEQINTIIRTIQNNEPAIREKSRLKTLGKKQNSLQKTFNWLKDKIGSSKQKQKLCFLNKSNVQTSRTVDMDDKILTKQEFLMTKIVKPYIVYLKKSIALFPFYQQLQKTKSLQLHQLWIIVKILRIMLKTSAGFNQAGRYYQNQFRQLVRVIKRAFNYQIYILYPILRSSIQGQIKKIEVYYLQQNKTKSIQDIVQVLIKDYKLNQLVSITQQITRLNEEIQYLFYSKYFFQQLTKGNPIHYLINTSSDKYDLMFQLSKVKRKTQIKQDQLLLNNPFVSRNKKNDEQQKKKGFRQLRLGAIQNRYKIRL